MDTNKMIYFLNECKKGFLSIAHCDMSFCKRNGFDFSGKSKMFLSSLVDGSSCNTKLFFISPLFLSTVSGRVWSLHLLLLSLCECFGSECWLTIVTILYYSDPDGDRKLTFSLFFVLLKLSYLKWQQNLFVALFPLCSIIISVWLHFYFYASLISTCHVI